MQNWQVRWSPTLGALESTHQEVWGTKDYENNTDPTCFFGLYGLPDFYTLWRHKGEKHILWAGTDIIHFKNGYWLDEKGQIHISSWALGKWINEYCTNWCENEVEQEALLTAGIEAKVQPSFLGDINAFEVSYQWSSRPKLYTSVSGDNFEQYGWNKIDKLAEENPNTEFHLYGNKSEWKSNLPNVIVHGRVPKEQMNSEIKTMQGALRLTEFDGFSEILAKSILMGQWPVSEIPYVFMLRTKDIWSLGIENTPAKNPNLTGRQQYRKFLNKYPWNTKS